MSSYYQFATVDAAALGRLFIGEDLELFQELLDLASEDGLIEDFEVFQGLDEDALIHRLREIARTLPQEGWLEVAEEEIDDAKLLQVGLYYLISEMEGLETEAPCEPIPLEAGRAFFRRLNAEESSPVVELIANAPAEGALLLSPEQFQQLAEEILDQPFEDHVEGLFEDVDEGIASLRELLENVGDDRCLIVTTG